MALFPVPRATLEMYEIISFGPVEVHYIPTEEESRSHRKIVQLASLQKTQSERTSTSFSDGKSESGKSEKNSAGADRNAKLSSVPQPVQKKTSIIGKKPDEKADRKSAKPRFAFQIAYGWEPLLCMSYQGYTRLIAQSNVPLCVSSTANLIIDGQNITIYAPRSVKVKGCYSVSAKLRSMPEKGLCVVYAMNMRRFGESIEVVITDGMTVFCEGRQRITILSSATVTIIYG
ncbi:hypothetical protein WR25_24431 [Diploscapter pachys]|uniref:Uncharacterized protein n=1 Tax=Diploscapter pachys TaxID=2018661 RepID=A0A2A2LJ88_9BILA|nr:hypothetical protein WR25_24431 [Diploscapter pachys]